MFNQKEYHKKYYQKNKEQLYLHNRDYQREKTREFKLQIHRLLGGKCVKCEYIGPALQIDHVNNDGYAERKKYYYAKCSYKYYNRILKLILAGSKSYQLLCANCNWEKRNDIIDINGEMDD